MKITKTRVNNGKIVSVYSKETGWINKSVYSKEFGWINNPIITETTLDKLPTEEESYAQSYIRKYRQYIEKKENGFFEI